MAHSCTDVLYSAMPVPDGPKVMNFNYTTGEVIQTYIYPEDLWLAKLQLNDIRINNTLGTGGYAFITEDTQYGSISTLDLDTGEFIRHLYNTTFTKPDERFTSMYNGEPIRNWNGTKPSYMNSGTNGIALASGNVYWGVKSSHRWYFVSQEALISGLADEELAAKVQVPGNIPSEQSGFTADDRGRVYMMASEVSTCPGESAMHRTPTLTRHSKTPSCTSTPSSPRSQTPSLPLRRMAPASCPRRTSSTRPSSGARSYKQLTRPASWMGGCTLIQTSRAWPR